jgi:Mn2+/Fe2+ NRAMP family transporter
MGVVTGQGLIGLIRQRYGVRSSALALVVLVLANVGTTCAEFAGIAAGSDSSASLPTSRCLSRQSWSQPWCYGDASIAWSIS